jgi:tetratricopeptide (TPR) repeat protein
MLTKKKKISRREIKEDKLVTTYYKVYGFVEDNKNKLLLYAGILAVVIIAIFFYLNNKEENNRIAGIQLSKVMSLYDNGAYLEAIEGQQGTDVWGLKRIVEEYGSTENGETAKIYLANSYMMLGKVDEAYKYYSDYSGGNDVFKATAIAGEGGYFALKQDYKKAADTYLKAAKVSNENVLNPEYLLSAGINYLKAGNHDRAKELLQTVKNDYVTAPAAREVDKYLALIN